MVNSKRQTNNSRIAHDVLGIMPLDYSLFTNDYSLFFSTNDYSLYHKELLIGEF
jgi:hypothetical protein